MGEEAVAQTITSVLENLEAIEINAQYVLDQCAEEKVVLEGLLLLMGWGTYRQKNVEKEGDFAPNAEQIREIGAIREGVAV